MPLTYKWEFPFQAEAFSGVKAKRDLDSQAVSWCEEKGKGDRVTAPKASVCAGFQTAAETQENLEAGLTVGKGAGTSSDSIRGKGQLLL